jgi:hypothetical protein
MRGAIPPFPNTPSRRGVQLKALRQFYLHLVLYQSPCTEANKNEATNYKLKLIQDKLYRDRAPIYPSLTLEQANRNLDLFRHKDTQSHRISL